MARFNASAFVSNCLRSIFGRPSGANIAAISSSAKPPARASAINANCWSTLASNNRRRPRRPTDWMSRRS